MQPEDLADAMKFVAALHPRTSVTELVTYPTVPEDLLARRDRAAGVASAIPIRALARRTGRMRFGSAPRFD